jgi:hypothetical protein
MGRKSRRLDYSLPFDGANLEPRIVSGCVALGTHGEAKRYYLETTPSRFEQVSVRSFGPSIARYIIDDEALGVFGRDPMTVGDLLKLRERTPYQEKLLDALRIYSRSSLAADPADKLIYILVALESMLVRDDGEALQSNIAERIAFLISDALPQRREIVQSVKAAYGLRSRFLHHGRRPEDLAVLTRFMNIAFRCVLGLNAHRMCRLPRLFTGRSTMRACLGDSFFLKLNLQRQKQLLCL